MEDKEINAKLSACKTVEELKTIGKEVGYELNDEEAKAYFEKFTKTGELNDDELELVSGGGCSKWRNGKAYSGNSPHWLIVTAGNSCPMYSFHESSKYGLKGTCMRCFHVTENGRLFTLYCTERTYEKDPLNP